MNNCPTCSRRLKLPTRSAHRATAGVDAAGVGPAGVPVAGPAVRLGAAEEGNGAAEEGIGAAEDGTGLGLIVGVPPQPTSTSTPTAAVSGLIDTEHTVRATTSVQ
jgi:hypothetical protein